MICWKLHAEGAKTKSEHGVKYWYPKICCGVIKSYHLKNIYLPEFWANMWKIENNDCSEAGQECNEHGVENVNEADESCQEVNRLKETIMIQCQLFRATEDENLKLKEDIQRIESINERY